MIAPNRSEDHWVRLKGRWLLVNGAAVVRKARFARETRSSADVQLVRVIMAQMKPESPRHDQNSVRANGEREIIGFVDRSEHPQSAPWWFAAWS